MSEQEPLTKFIQQRDAAIASGADYCADCGQVNGWPHDHKPDGSGLDDGPWLPGRAPRKRPARKQADELSEIRKRAWTTRREKYGAFGHR